MTHSHRALTIVLGRDEPHLRNLVVACGPIRICGPVEWVDADLEVAVVVLADGNEGFRVTDSGCGLEVLCDMFEVSENVKL